MDSESALTAPSSKHCSHGPSIQCVKLVHKFERLCPRGLPKSTWIASEVESGGQGQHRKGTTAKDQKVGVRRIGAARRGQQGSEQAAFHWLDIGGGSQIHTRYTHAHSHHTAHVHTHTHTHTHHPHLHTHASLLICTLVHITTIPHVDTCTHTYTHTHHTRAQVCHTTQTHTYTHAGHAALPSQETLMMHLKQPTFFSHRQHVSGLNSNCSFNFTASPHPQHPPAIPVSRVPCPLGGKVCTVLNLVDFIFWKIQ